MPWKNSRVVKNTQLDDVFSLTVEWEDAAEFVEPWTYTNTRTTNSVGGRSAFKRAAEDAREAERTRRNNVSGKETAILAFMNS